MKFQIDNEYDRLEAVLVHRPGLEIERLTHETMNAFLFEDIPYLRRMQDEHDAFVAIMRERGIEVVYLERLLAEVLAEEKARVELVEAVCQAALTPAIAEDLIGLQHWDCEGLVELMFAGLTAGEYHAATGRRISSAGDDDHFLLPPIPNAYFTRDPAVTVRDAVISSKMHYPARVRESLLTRAVLEHHRELRDNAIVYGRSDRPDEDRPYTIEGGDVIMLSAEAVLIGASERTRSETIELLAGKCFDLDLVKRIYEIPIPAERAFMHLDTIFTVLDRGTVLWFSQVMERIDHVHRLEPAADHEDGGGVRRTVDERPFVDVLRDEFGCDLTLIDTAGGTKHFASREQRTDGTNTFAIAPRVAMAYARNERTAAALESHGIECVTIDGSELVRGLGGPRCMTMPLRRASSSG